MKVCTKCKVEKQIIFFGKIKKSKDGYRSQCKACVKQYRSENSNHIIEYRKQYAIKNKENKRLYTLKNKDKIREQNKQYRLKNKEKYKQYRLDNKEYIKYKSNQYQINRKLNDPLFKLTSLIRNAISTHIKRQGYSKKSKTYEILGCSFEDFKIHLEQQFTEGMTWENYGKWHMDHIYPASRSIDEEHLIKLNHYTNFQPLWAEDNIKKGNKI